MDFLRTSEGGFLSSKVPPPPTFPTPINCLNRLEGSSGPCFSLVSRVWKERRGVIPCPGAVLLLWWMDGDISVSGIDQAGSVPDRGGGGILPLINSVVNIIYMEHYCKVIFYLSDIMSYSDMLC